MGSIDFLSQQPVDPLTTAAVQQLDKALYGDAITVLEKGIHDVAGRHVIDHFVL